jgi:hypothetical protein
MTTFVNPHFPATHPGVERAEHVAEKLQGWGQWFASARGVATLLASAGVAAVLAVADQLIDTWADGHLVAAWAFLWAIGFLTLVVLGPVAKTFAADYLASLRAYRETSALANSEARLLDAAARDPRLADDLKAAILRHEALASRETDAAAGARRVAQADTARAVLHGALYQAPAVRWGHLPYL